MLSHKSKRRADAELKPWTDVLSSEVIPSRSVSVAGGLGCARVIDLLINEGWPLY
jgi:hypothetical protein